MLFIGLDYSTASQEDQENEAFWEEALYSVYCKAKDAGNNKINSQSESVLNQSMHGIKDVFKLASTLVVAAWIIMFTGKVVCFLLMGQENCICKLKWRSYDGMTGKVAQFKKFDEVGVSAVPTCVVFISLCSTCKQLSHGGSHWLWGAAQILSTLLQLRQRESEENHNSSFSCKSLKTRYKGNPLDSTSCVSSWQSTYSISL